MKKNGKNEELQSRREFFKRAAKGALPILAGAALLSSPILSETANAMSCAGCNNRCMNSCFNTLKSYIYNSVAELRLDTYNEDEEIDNLKNELKSYNEGRTSFDDIKKTLKKVLNKNEQILYILNQL